jgi:iduronate 2-sulfatase
VQLSKTLVLFLFIGFCSSCCQSGFAQQPNVLLICVDDLRPELNCFGQYHIHSPNIDKLASAGRPFPRHYVQSPTCGASRYALLTGLYGGSSNNALFNRAKRLAANEASVHPSMPAWFKSHGYESVSVGKVSYHPGGRGGKNWDDDSVKEMPNSWDRHLLPAGPWQHPRGAMHGLADGEIRINPEKMDVFQAVDALDSSYPDGLIAGAAISELDQLSKNAKPFFLAVGFIRPHLPFGAPENYLKLYDDVEFPEIAHSEKPAGKTTWHASGEFNRYNRWGKDPNVDREFALEVRRHYAACVSYADAQVGRVLDHVDRLGVRDDTIVVLWGDHGWHLGEHAIWGKHALFEESLRSPLIIQHRGIGKPGEPSDSIVETIDVFPTLCDLAGLPKPEFAKGVSLKGIVNHNRASPNRAAYAYRGNRKTVRTESHRLILHGDGYVELYDHASNEKETVNVADKFPEVVESMKRRLEARFKK